jgi:2-dehydro-3-deoxygluconokinase
LNLKIEYEPAPDPVGAGDAFNAGYIASCLSGKSAEESLRVAVHCGRAVATSPGDTGGFPRDLQLRV